MKKILKRNKGNLNLFRLPDSFKLLKKNKHTIIAAGTLILATLVSGCSNSKEAPVTDPTPQVVQEQVQDEKDATEENEEETKKEFGFLSDEFLLDIDGLTMVNTLDTKKEAELIDIDSVDDEYALEDGTIVKGDADSTVEVSFPGDVYIDENGEAWTSKEEYENFIKDQEEVYEEAGKDATDGYYQAPDGSLWESEEDYKNSLVGEEIVDTPPADDNTGKDDEELDDNVDVDGSYKAPDGEVWASEEEYLEFINGQDTTGDLWEAPDGSFWDSEEKYNDYQASLSNSDTGSSDVIPEEPPIIEEEEGYLAPDGSYWTSREEYEEYINANPEATSVDTYVAPDGNIYENEAEYNSIIAAQSEVVQEETVETQQEQQVTIAEETETVEEVNEVEEVIVEQEATITPEEYFTAPDGSVWVSEADYNAYMSEMTQEAEKTL